MVDAYTVLKQLLHPHRNANHLVGQVEDEEKLSITEDTSQDNPNQSNITRLMVDAHTALKGSIKALDVVHWLSRAVKTLLEAGEELNKRHPYGSADQDWFHLEAYLKDISRLCESLEADPQMAEKRCRAQIDIVCSLRSLKNKM